MMYNSEVLSVWIKRRRYAYGLDYYKKNSRCIAKSIPKFNSLHSAIKIDKLFSLLFSFYKCGGLNFFYYELTKNNYILYAALVELAVGMVIKKRNWIKYEYIRNIWF